MINVKETEYTKKIFFCVCAGRYILQPNQPLVPTAQFNVDHTTEPLPRPPLALELQKIVYNRVEKCASATMKGLIIRMATTNNYTYDFIGDSKRQRHKSVSEVWISMAICFC